MWRRDKPTKPSIPAVSVPWSGGSNSMPISPGVMPVDMKYYSATGVMSNPLYVATAMSIQMMYDIQNMKPGEVRTFYNLDAKPALPKVTDMTVRIERKFRIEE